MLAQGKRGVKAQANSSFEVAGRYLESDDIMWIASINSTCSPDGKVSLESTGNAFMLTEAPESGRARATPASAATAGTAPAAAARTALAAAVGTASAAAGTASAAGAPAGSLGAWAGLAERTRLVGPGHCCGQSCER